MFFAQKFKYICEINIKNINYLGICNKLDISKLNLNKDYEIYSYNELTKNYSQDRKTFDLIQNKFQELNLNPHLQILR